MSFVDSWCFDGLFENIWCAYVNKIRMELKYVFILNYNLIETSPILRSAQCKTPYSIIQQTVIKISVEKTCNNIQQITLILNNTFILEMRISNRIEEPVIYMVINTTFHIPLIVCYGIHRKVKKKLYKTIILLYSKNEKGILIGNRLY